MPTGGAGYTLLVALAPASEELVDALQQIEVERTLDQASVVRLRFGTTATEIGDWSILEPRPVPAAHAPATAAPSPAQALPRR